MHPTSTSRFGLISLSPQLDDDDIAFLLSGIPSDAGGASRQSATVSTVSTVTVRNDHRSPVVAGEGSDFETGVVGSLKRLLASRPPVAVVLNFCEQALDFAPSGEAFRLKVYEALLAHAASHPQTALPVLTHYLSPYHEPSLDNRLFLIDRLGDYLGYRRVLDRFLDLLDVYYEHAHEATHLTLLKLSIVAPLPKVYQRLLDILRSGREPFIAIRENILLILGHLAPSLPPVRDGLRDILTDRRETAPKLRSVMLRILVGTLPSEEVLELLVRQTNCTHEPSAAVRLEAYEQLSQLSDHGPAVTSHLVSTLLSHGEPDVTCQMFIIKTLQKQASVSSSAVDALQYVVAHGTLFDDEVVIQSLFALLTAAGTSGDARRAVETTLSDETLRSHLNGIGAFHFLFNHMLAHTELHDLFKRLAGDDVACHEVFAELVRCIKDEIHCKSMPSLPLTGM